jgi:hypothetical protein
MNRQYIIIYSPKLQEKQIKTEGTINIMIEKPHSKTICSSPCNYLTIRFQIPPHRPIPPKHQLGMMVCPFAIPETKASNTTANKRVSE